MMPAALHSDQGHPLYQEQTTSDAQEKGLEPLAALISALGEGASRCDPLLVCLPAQQ